MYKLLWCTDLHLDLLPGAGPRTFGECLSAEAPFDAVVVTGDIAEPSWRVRSLLERFAQGVGQPVFFTLGNHDAYGGSFAALHKTVRGIVDPNIIWLDEAPVWALDEHTALVGQGGWYDGILGDAKRSEILVKDFRLISDLARHFDRRTWEDGERSELLKVLRAMSREQAERARIKLFAALRVRKNVIFATHFPPFLGASWSEGELSDRHWLPWTVSAIMGEMLDETAKAYPDHNITVLCGHTHSPGVYQHLPNLIVYTGKAKYHEPDLAGLCEITDGEQKWVMTSTK